MKVAIVGSRNYPHAGDIWRYIERRMYRAEDTIISGGAAGVDSIAAEAAKHYDFPIRVHLPDWEAHGKRAGAIRNQKIVDDADMVVAFWDGKSNGTKITIDMALRAGKTCLVYVNGLGA